MGTAEFDEWDLTSAMDQTQELGAWAGTKIAESVASSYGMTVGEMLSRRRGAIYVEARARLYERLSTEAGWPAARIGRFCKRDHTTVLHHLGMLSRTIGRKPGSAWLAKSNQERLHKSTTATNSGAREVA